MEPWVVPSFDGIGDESTDDRCELEAVTASAGCDNKAGSLRILTDPEISIEAVTIQTDARTDDRCIRQLGKGVTEEGPSELQVLRRDFTASIGVHGSTVGVVTELESAVTE